MHEQMMLRHYSWRGTSERTLPRCPSPAKRLCRTTTKRRRLFFDGLPFFFACHGTVQRRLKEGEEEEEEEEPEWKGGQLGVSGAGAAEKGSCGFVWVRFNGEGPLSRERADHGGEFRSLEGRQSMVCSRARQLLLAWWAFLLSRQARST